jgi:glycerate kinase
VRILLAPDKFKDALDAPAVCDALAAGVAEALPAATIERCPMADGGEGSGRILAAALGACEHTARVLDAIGRERAARWWFAPQQDKTAIVELAEASGLYLLEPRQRRAAQTTSYGTGQLLAAAAAAGARRALLCVGGSATVDGGAGCLQALGWELLDEAGRPLELPMCGGRLELVRSLRPPPTRLELDIEVLCDVSNPLTGPDGAAHVFGPQKGADPQEIEKLARALDSWAVVLERTTGQDVRTLSGAGAAGGVPAALAAATGARLTPGIDRIADLLKLDARLAHCDLCLTGEGRLDDQTFAGKVVAGVTRHAAAADVPVVAFVGALRTTAGQDRHAAAYALGLRDIVVITPDDTPLEAALAQTEPNLRAAAERYLRRTFGDLGV